MLLPPALKPTSKLFNPPSMFVARPKDGVLKNIKKYFK